MIDDRQFFISNTTIAGWKTKKLWCVNKYLSYKQDLPVVFNSDNSCVLIGDAWQSDSSQIAPKEIIQLWNANTKDDEIYRIEESWCGRYVIIVGSRIFQDATSQFTSFYDGQRNVSSSLRVLREIMGEEICFPKIHYGIGLNFIPGPLTHFQGIYKILPSQVYDFVTGAIYERPLLPNGIRKYSKESVEELSDCFIHSLREMRKCINSEIKVALTGGYDSRTLLSLIERSGIDYSCYTFETNTMHSGGDVEIPPQLCGLIDRSHSFIKMRKLNFSFKRKKEYLIHSVGMARDGDLYHYAYGQYDELSDGGKVLVLYSGIWETVREYYAVITKGFKRARIDMKDIVEAFPEIAYDETKTESIEKWLTLTNGSVLNLEISSVDRFYWDLRAGCWMSYVSQSFDMIDNVQMIQPCNCRLFLSYLLGWSREDRIQKKHQVDIIRYNKPELLGVLFTDDYPLRKKEFGRIWLNRFKRYYFYTKWYGTKWLFLGKMHEWKAKRTN